RRRHTRFSRDWSSDVCSSDLGTPAPAAGMVARDRWPPEGKADGEEQDPLLLHRVPERHDAMAGPVSRLRSLEHAGRAAGADAWKIGRASCMGRVQPAKAYAHC